MKSRGRSGFAGDYAATTDANGSYTITGILPGTYPKVFSRRAGFDPIVRTVSVAARANTLDWALRRDSAASGGGGAIVAFTPPGYTDFGCGAAHRPVAGYAGQSVGRLSSRGVSG
jgi:extracellular elastinolytic metalloproteinase